MKLLTILLILLQINTFGYGNYNSPYSNNYNSYSSESYQQNRYRGIGYTTNYSNGQFNSTQYYRGTYTPAASSSGRRPGQPRRVKGYTADGDSINPTGKAGNPDPMWQKEYDYYYWDGHWYRNDGSSWSEWRTPLDWGWTLWDWRSGKPGTSNPTQYYKDPPTPIGDAILPLLTILLLYIGYDTLVKSRLKK